MTRIDAQLDHLLRRAGFGVSESDARRWGGMEYEQAVKALVDADLSAPDIDQQIGQDGYLKVVSTEPFDPTNNLMDALQRWVFRMVHSERPLQEKMALFWHNHFATGRSKVIEKLSFPGATRSFATKPDEDPDGAMGQIEMFRRLGLDNFGDLVIGVAQDPAMIAFLDGDTNIVGRPQENFGRELMELFTIGAANHTEEDVYSAARVFTGWNLAPIRADAEDVHYRGFQYYPQYHDTGYKTFSFPIYPDGNNTIPAREAPDGLQDGIDLLRALAAHPATGAFLARKLYAYFADEGEADVRTIEAMADAYYARGQSIREVLRVLFLSPLFRDSATHWGRLSWPAEYVARSIKEVGHSAYTADNAVFATMSMGQSLFDPPSVGGWGTGRQWFSTTTMLARMNFAMALSWAEQEKLVIGARPSAGDADQFLAHFLDRFSYKAFDEPAVDALRAYLTGSPWAQDEVSLAKNVSGLTHLIVASGQYQLI